VVVGGIVDVRGVKGRNSRKATSVKKMRMIVMKVQSMKSIISREDETKKCMNGQGKGKEHGSVASLFARVH